MRAALERRLTLLSGAAAGILCGFAALRLA